MILMACAECDRQYDVSHLEPGRSIRCFCDAVFRVRHTGPTSVAAKTCTNCGGPVGPEHEACPFCSAALDEAELGSTLCPKCFARVADDARHCSSCGVGIEPQALMPIPEGRDCPRCEGALRVRSFGERSAIECGSCEGIWLTREVFDGVCRDALRSCAPPPTVPSTPLRREGTTYEGYIDCLACGETMLRQQYRRHGRSSGVVVDACRSHGIWLDHSELERVLSFVRDEPVGLHDLGSISLPDAGQTAEREPNRRLPTVVPPPERPHPVAEAVRYLARLVDDFLG